MLHVYCGDGKGKTTAAMGLALRALGTGLRPAVVQFLKDGTSPEVCVLRERLGAPVFANTPPVPFSFAMTASERAAVRAENEENLHRGLALLEGGTCDLLVLDEVLGALETGLLADKPLRRIVELAAGRPEGAEVVLTGRVVPPWLAELADYLTRMTAERHPYERGVPARRGIEF